MTSHTDHFEMQKRDSEKSLLTFINLFPKYSTICTACLHCHFQMIVSDPGELPSIGI